MDFIIYDSGNYYLRPMNPKQRQERRDQDQEAFKETINGPKRTIEAV